MRVCPSCGKESDVWYSCDKASICASCYRVAERSRILASGEAVQKSSDFSSWRHRDLSELFWLHLAEYRKNPNPRSLSLIAIAYRWACHDNHALANSMAHALEWCEIDLIAEQERWRAQNKTKEKNI